MGLNWRAAARGALVGLVVIIPLSILNEIVSPGSDSPKGVWVAVLAVGILGAFLLAGFVAAERQPDLPYAHGILGGLGALVFWVVISLVRDAFTSRSPHFRDILSAALLAVAFGIIGGVISNRRSVRTPET